VQSLCVEIDFRVLQLTDEGLAVAACLCQLCAVDATRSSVKPTEESTARWSPVAATTCFQKLCYVIASAFSSDDHAGVQDLSRCYNPMSEKPTLAEIAQRLGRFGSEAMNRIGLPEQCGQNIIATRCSFSAHRNAFLRKVRVRAMGR
jgi:hypothetical protein